MYRRGKETNKAMATCNTRAITNQRPRIGVLVELREETYITKVANELRVTKNVAYLLPTIRLIDCELRRFWPDHREVPACKDTVSGATTMQFLLVCGNKAAGMTCLNTGKGTRAYGSNRSSIWAIEHPAFASQVGISSWETVIPSATVSVVNKKEHQPRKPT